MLKVHMLNSQEFDINMCGLKSSKSSKATLNNIFCMFYFLWCFQQSSSVCLWNLSFNSLLPQQISIFVAVAVSLAFHDVRKVLKLKWWISSSWCKNVKRHLHHLYLNDEIVFSIRTRSNSNFLSFHSQNMTYTEKQM